MSVRNMESPNNQSNYERVCRLFIERGTIRRECGKLLEGKRLSDVELRAMLDAIAEVTDEVAPRPRYAPYSISESADSPPANDSTLSVSRRPVVSEEGTGVEEGDSVGAEPLRRAHPTPEHQGHRRSRSGPPVRDSILICVGESKSIRQVDLASKIGVDPKPLYNIVNSMVADGQLVKVTKPFGPSSREVTFIEITDTGKKVLERITRT